MIGKFLAVGSGSHDDDDDKPFGDELALTVCIVAPSLLSMPVAAVLEVKPRISTMSLLLRAILGPGRGSYLVHLAAVAAHSRTRRPPLELPRVRRQTNQEPERQNEVAPQGYQSFPRD